MSTVVSLHCRRASITLRTLVSLTAPWPSCLCFCCRRVHQDLQVFMLESDFSNNANSHKKRDLVLTTWPAE